MTHLCLLLALSLGIGKYCLVFYSQPEHPQNHTETTAAGRSDLVWTLTWCHRANNHRFLTPRHEAKAQHRVSPHLHLPWSWRDDLAAGKPRVIKWDCLCHVTVENIGKRRRYQCGD